MEPRNLPMYLTRNRNQDPSCSGGHSHHLSHTSQRGTPSFCRVLSVPCPQAAPCKKDCNSCLYDPLGACALSQNSLAGPASAGWRGSPLLCTVPFFPLRPTFPKGHRGPSHTHPGGSCPRPGPRWLPAFLPMASSLLIPPVPSPGLKHSPFCALSLPLHVQSGHLRCPFRQPSRIVQVAPPDRGAQERGMPHSRAARPAGRAGAGGGGKEEGRSRRPSFSLSPLAGEPPPAERSAQVGDPRARRLPRGAEAAGQQPGNRVGVAGS